MTGSFTMPGATTATIELFANSIPTPGADPSGYGEGETFLGTVTVTLKGKGKFRVDLPPVPAGTVISATATDSNGNTSEFSNDVTARGH